MLREFHLNFFSWKGEKVIAIKVDSLTNHHILVKLTISLSSFRHTHLESNLKHQPSLGICQ